MNLTDIIESGLKQNGFDGLVNPGLCGCQIGALSPAECICSDCMGGYKHAHSKTGEWIISIKKEDISDAEIQQCIDECS